MKKVVAGIACFFSISFFAQSQSIYSFEGLGSLLHQGMPNNVAMGEVGIGTPTIWHVNTQNPANLVYNGFSAFQFGVQVDQRKFSGADVSGSGTDGGLRFLAYAFPIIPGKWSSSFGILPYSNVSYNTFSENQVPNAPANVISVSDDRGEGGLTNFFWSNGVRLNSSLSLGIKSTFTFGSISKTSDLYIVEETDLDNDGVLDRQVLSDGKRVSLQESYSDITFQFGASYSYKISDLKALNFGLIYGLESDLNGESELSTSLLSRSSITIGDPQIRDISQAIPQTMGFGVSYQKLNQFVIGFDMETQNWESVGTDREPFENFSKIALGIEWTPDYDNVNSYFKRAKYSIGLNRTKLPYVVNNQVLTDFGVNFGASLPVKGFSSMDLAFKWGQLGETSNGLIKENYYKIVIGATINDRWFIKRKYD